MLDLVPGKVYTKLYDGFPLDEKAALSYARSGGKEEDKRLIEEMYSLLEPELSYRLCYSVFDLPVDTYGSETLKEYLRGAEKLIMLAGTIGIGTDKLMRKMSHVSPLKELMVQGVGAAQIERMLDYFSEEVGEAAAEEGMASLKRISPGYGDMSLEMQGSIIDKLDAGRKIGVKLNSGGVMSPTKSVTAFIALKVE